MTTSHLQYRANRVAASRPWPKVPACCLSYTASIHVQFDIEAATILPALLCPWRPIIAFCLRFGVIDARTPGGRFRRSRGPPDWPQAVSRASALRTEGISFARWQTHTPCNTPSPLSPFIAADVLIFGFHSNRRHWVIVFVRVGIDKHKSYANVGYGSVRSVSSTPVKRGGITMASTTGDSGKDDASRRS